MNGVQVADAICDGVRNELERDCLLAGHLIYRGFHANGGLELQLQLDEQRTVRTGIVIQVPSAAIPERHQEEPPQETGVAVPAGPSEPDARQPTQSVPVPTPSEQASLDRLRALIHQFPGCSQNELFRRSGMGRTRLFRLLNSYDGIFWTFEQDGQTRRYYPKPSIPAD